MGGGYGVSNNPATSDPSPLDQIREQTSKIEDFFDTISEPIKPYVFFQICLFSFLHSNRYGNANKNLVQISPSNRPLLDRRHFPRRRTEDNNTMGRSATLPPRLQAQ
jgi:hypothetical protein